MCVLYMCICVYESMHMLFMCTCVHMETRGWSECPSCLHVCVWGCGLCMTYVHVENRDRYQTHINLHLISEMGSPTQIDSIASQLQGSTCLYFLALGHRHALLYPAVYGCWGSKLTSSCLQHLANRGNRLFWSIFLFFSYDIQFKPPLSPLEIRAMVTWLFSDTEQVPTLHHQWGGKNTRHIEMIISA